MIKKALFRGMFLFSLTVVVLVSTNSVYACQKKKIVRSLQNTYEKTIDITADFKQITHTPGDPNAIVAKGKVYFKRPHLMRWDYSEPEEQVIVTSGPNVYLWEKEAHQVSVLPRKRFLSSKVSRAFFFGKGNIERDFFVDWCKSQGRLYKLKLRPKTKTPQLKTLLLFVDKKSFLVKKTIVEDQLGSTTEIEFSNIKVNKNIPDETFKFTPPKGVEIFEIN